MRILVAGAGAVGGYFGARMIEAGLDVTFLLRPQSAKLLREQGIRISSRFGDVSIDHPKAVHADSDYHAPDVVFFASKAEHVSASAAAAARLAGPKTLFVPLQNGVKSPEMLTAVLGPERVLGGLSRIFAERKSPGRIEHTGILPSITFGEMAGGVSARASGLEDLLKPAQGMVADASPDVWTEMWTKLVMVCSIGSVGAVSRAPLGVLLAVPETRSLLQAAGEEIAAVGNACRASIPEGLVVKMLARYEKLSPLTTASMHRDLERGEPSELNDQLGTVCRDAREKSVATPVLDALYGALLPGERRARRELDYAGVAQRDVAG